MTETRIALGLDVSKLHVDVCLLFADGKKLKTRIPNTEAGFRELLNWLNGIDLQLVHACLEPTGRYSRPLANFLFEQGIKVSLVNSFAVQNHGRSMNFRNKTDRIDAFLLADYCMKHNPQEWAPEPRKQMELRDLQHRLANIDELIRQEENRLEAGTDSKFVKEDIEDSLGRLYVRKKRLAAEAKKLVKCDEELAPNFKILASIVGVGDASAIQMLASVRFEKFTSGRKVACFAGLTPRQYESGTSVSRRSGISRIGNSELRAALFFPAMSAMQYNPHLREFADRLRRQNKPSKVIICAVMRKLLVLAAALIRKQEMYDPEFKTSVLVAG